MTTWLAYFPSPPRGRLAPRAVAHPRVRAVHHRRHRGRTADRGPALGGPRRRAWRDLRHRAVGGAFRIDRRPALSPGHRLADLLRARAVPVWARRCESGTAAWASGAPWPSVASARGSAVGVAEFRCRPSPTRLRPESSWRRPSVGSGTTSTRSSTVAKRRCRGAWRSSTGGIPRDSSTSHSLDGISTGQLALVVQPTFLYELIWNVLVFVALIYLDRRFTLGHGRLFAIYVAVLLRRAVLASNCCATTPPPTSQASESTRSHRLSSSSGPWSTSCWRRRVARIPRACAAPIMLPRNCRKLNQKPNRRMSSPLSLRHPLQLRRRQLLPQGTKKRLNSRRHGVRHSRSRSRGARNGEGSSRRCRSRGG